MFFILLLIGGGFAALHYAAKQKIRTQGDRPRQNVSYYAKRSLRVKNQWAKPGTISAHQTGPTQPKDTGPQQSARVYSNEMANLQTRIAQTSDPEWKMRFRRALLRAGGQISRNHSRTRAGNVPYQIADRMGPDVAPASDAETRKEPASRWTRVQASRQARFRHPGMLQDQPVQQHSRGFGVANRRINRAENPCRVRTIRGQWKGVTYS